MNILFIDTVHPFLINALREDGHNCIEGHKFTMDEILSHMMDMHGVVIRSRIQLDKKLLEYLEEIKVSVDEITAYENAMKAKEKEGTTEEGKAAGATESTNNN